MGLDVYVGSLTRYYLGDWETIVQQMGRELGREVSIVYANPRKETWLSRIVGWLRPSGPAATEKAVRRWRDRLRRELRLPDLDWNDAPEAEYLTDKPAWDGYGALLLWAAYDEHPDAARRETADGWEQDAAYLASMRDPRSRYGHLIADTEIWLPVEFDPPAKTRRMTGQPVTIGSSPRLVRELRELNARTWGASDSQISQWRRDAAPFGAPLEVSARFAFAVFYELGLRAVAARLPMTLDY